MQACPSALHAGAPPVPELVVVVVVPAPPVPELVVVVVPAPPIAEVVVVVVAPPVPAPPSPVVVEPDPVAPPDEDELVNVMSLLPHPGAAEAAARTASAPAARRAKRRVEGVEVLMAQASRYENSCREGSRS